MSQLKKDINNTVFTVTKEESIHVAGSVTHVDAPQQTPHIVSANKPVDAASESEVLADAFKNNVAIKDNVVENNIRKLLLVAQSANITKNYAINAASAAYKTLQSAEAAANRAGEAARTASQNIADFKARKAADVANDVLNIAQNTNDDAYKTYLNTDFKNKDAKFAAARMKLRTAEDNYKTAENYAVSARSDVVVASKAATSAAAQYMRDALKAMLAVTNDVSTDNVSTDDVSTDDVSTDDVSTDNVSTDNVNTDEYIAIRDAYKTANKYVIAASLIARGEYVEDI